MRSNTENVSHERSRCSRPAARRERRKPLRLRGVSLCLVAVVLGMGSTGVAVSPADTPSTSTGAATAEVTLRKGDRGRAVSAVQRRLGLKADGFFGSRTVRAVKRFQARRGLAPDGIVGPLTRAALGLRAFSFESVVHPKGGRGGETRRAQGLRNLPEALVRIAQCESGGDPTAVSSTGRYRGKYQFSRSTWRQWGGRGDPAEASEAEQDRVALRLYRAHGVAPWPTCGADGLSRRPGGSSKRR